MWYFSVSLWDHCDNQGCNQLFLSGFIFSYLNLLFGLLNCILFSVKNPLNVMITFLPKLATALHVVNNSQDTKPLGCVLEHLPSHIISQTLYSVQIITVSSKTTGHTLLFTHWQSWTRSSLIGCGLSSFPLFLASFQYFPSSCNPFRGSLVHSRREKHSRGIEEQKAGTHVTPTASTVGSWGSDSTERRDNPVRGSGFSRKPGHHSALWYWLLGQKVTSCLFRCVIHNKVGIMNGKYCRNNISYCWRGMEYNKVNLLKCCNFEVGLLVFIPLLLWHTSSTSHFKSTLYFALLHV